MKTTSREEFEKFRDLCQEWVDRFGITEWDLSFEHGKLDPDALAQVDTDPEDKSAIISFNMEPDTDYALNLEELALHEVLELVLTNLDEMAQERKWNDDAWIQERHAVINRLSRVLRQQTRKE